jgi:prevent-host-death family protein
MQQLIPIRDINQHLSRYIDIVENGSDIIITRRGKPVARLTSITEPQTLTKKQQAARQRTLARMNQGFELGGEVFDRDASHER